MCVKIAKKFFLHAWHTNVKLRSIVWLWCVNVCNSHHYHHITHKTSHSTYVRCKRWCSNICESSRRALLSKIEQHIGESDRYIYIYLMWSVVVVGVFVCAVDVFMLHNFQEVTHSVDLTCQLCEMCNAKHLQSLGRMLFFLYIYFVMQHTNTHTRSGEE